MKKNSTKLFTIICLFFIFSTLTACGTQSKYVGNWTASKISVSGITLDLEKLNLSITMEIKADGNFQIISDGADTSASDTEAAEEMDGKGQWKETEDGIQLSYNKKSMDGKIDSDSSLTFDISNNGTECTIIFIKSDAKNMKTKSKTTSSVSDTSSGTTDRENSEQSKTSSSIESNTTEERPDREGYKEGTGIYSFDNLDVPIPSYFEEYSSDDTSELWQLEGGRGGYSACFELSKVDESSNMNQLTSLDSDTITDAIIDKVMEDKDVFVTKETLKIAGYNGGIFQFNRPKNNWYIECYYAYIINTDTKNLDEFYLMQSNNASYNYLYDFMRVLNGTTAQPKSSGAATESVTAQETYQSILDEYTKKIQDTTPTLVNEYNQRATENTDGVTGLAQISNEEIQKLAAINNEGIQKMASLYWANSSGKYEEYQSYATKLTNVYMTESQKITDAYMASVS